MARAVINKEYCKDKVLLFYPKDKKESELIQRNLFKLGYSWADVGQKISYINACIEHGISISDKTGIKYGYNTKDSKKLSICFIEQFETNEEILLEDLGQSINNLSRRSRRKLLYNLKNSFSDDFEIVAGSTNIAKTKRNIKLKEPIIFKRKP